MSIYAMRTKFGHGLKWGMGFIAFIFVVGAVYQFGAAPAGRNGNPGGDRVLANVNGYDITQNEFDAMWVPQSKQAANQGMTTTLELANLRSQIFKQLVQSRLLLSFAARQHIDISKSAVEAKLDEKIVEYLKQDRRMVLQNISGDEDRTDPREDRKYISALAEYQMTLNSREEIARLNNPESQIQTELAAQGIRDSLKKQAGTVTDSDVDASYTQYKLDKLVVGPSSLPKEQLLSKANKVLEEARKPGADFAALAKNTPEILDKTVSMSYSFDTQMAVPTQVSKLIEKMKPGEVSDAIDTPAGIYIVKLIGATPSLPAKLDKKARDKRREQIQNMREMMIAMDVSKQMQEKSQVNVLDNEMRGYYHLGMAQEAAMRDQGTYQKELSMTEKAFKKQIKEVKGDPFSTAMYAQVLMMLGKYSEAVNHLHGLVEGGTSAAQGTDLRMMYGDALVKTNEKDKALEQYQKASEASASNPSIHMMLGQKFNDLGRKDLAAAEKAKADEIQKRMQEYQAKMKSKTATIPVPSAPKSAPKPAPKPGG